MLLFFGVLRGNGRLEVLLTVLYSTTAAHSDPIFVVIYVPSHR